MTQPCIVITFHEVCLQANRKKIDYQENMLLKIQKINIRFLGPLIYGKYPASMQSLVGARLLNFTSSESKLVAGSIDFLGINHYTSLYVRNDRTRIRKLIMDDAQTDSAIIKTGMVNF
jgi:beta-glucosidase/6-phospho-beta-glucosidase/beta-galactosidase